MTLRLKTNMDFSCALYIWILVCIQALFAFDPVSSKNLVQFTRYLDDARFVASTNSTRSLQVRRLSLCSQLCLLEYADQCTFMNYCVANKTCVISNGAVDPYLMVTAPAVGWTSYHTYEIEDGYWGAWGQWSACSATCNEGTRSRTRSCVPPKYEGKPCQGNSSASETCNEQECPWVLVFKGSKGIGSSARDLWVGSGYTSSPSADMLQTNSGSSAHYKSSIVENWSSLNVQKVKFAFYTGGSEVMKVVFNGQGSTKTNFFAKGRLLEDPWDDLSSLASLNYVSIDGGGGSRRFFINKQYGGCNGDAGWVVVVDAYDSGCSNWDKMLSWPQFVYSSTANYLNWGNNWGSNAKMADVMAIYLKY